LYPGLWAAALLAMFSIAPAPAAAGTTAVHSQRYDASKEVTLQATVADVVVRATVEMYPGSHLMLHTGSGLVDASLGSFALAGKDALSFTPGQSIKVTGIKMEFNAKEVFVIRTIEMDGRVYNIRSEHGFALKHPGRDLSAAAVTKGGQR